MRNATAAVALSTRDCVLTVERTWATAVYDRYERVAFYAAREPEIAAELLVSLALVGTIFAAVPATESLDVAVLVSAAPRELVSSERAVSGGRFGEVEAVLENPRAEVPGYHIDSGRFPLADVHAGYPVAAELLGPWLSRFRGDDLLSRLRD